MIQLTSLDKPTEFRLFNNFHLNKDYIDSFNKFAIPYSMVNDTDLKGNSGKLRHKKAKMSKAWGYVTENTMYKQAHFDSSDRDNTPAWILEIADHIRDSEHLSDIVCTITRQDPGNSLPPHVDVYDSYRKKKNIPEEDAKNIIRYLVFLEDWKIGHFLQFGDSVCCYWKKGDCITWEYGLRHLSTNAGTESKFAMQITGVQKNTGITLDALE